MAKCLQQIMQKCVFLRCLLLKNANKKRWVFNVLRLFKNALKWTMSGLQNIIGVSGNIFGNKWNILASFKSKCFMNWIAGGFSFSVLAFCRLFCVLSCLLCSASFSRRNQVDGLPRAVSPGFGFEQVNRAAKMWKRFRKHLVDLWMESKRILDKIWLDCAWVPHGFGMRS